MHRSMRFIAAALSAAFLPAANALATTITTTSFSTWTSSAYITGTSTDVSLGTACSGNCPGGSITAGGFTFAGQSLAETLTSPAGLTAASINITAPSGGKTAIFLFERGGAYNVTLSDGEVFSGLSGFWGFSSTAPITSLSLTGSSPILYALSYAISSQIQEPPPSETPEATTFLLSSGGLLILLGSGRKLARKATI
jgi:hypothetical protein